MSAQDTAAPQRFAATWFTAWLWFFGLAIAASLATTTFGLVPQMKWLGAASLGAAVLGFLVCLLGVRLYDPPRWRMLRSQMWSVRDSARSAGAALAQSHPSRA